MSLTTNVKEKADLIWSIADKLTGVYKPHEYGRVILPLTVIRRFDCVLAKTKAEVLKVQCENKDIDFLKKRKLKNASGYDFYNVSPFTFEKIVAAPNDVKANFKNYLNGFSKNVCNIIEKFNFDSEIERMDSKNILNIVLTEFTSDKANFHPDKISNLEMGYVFEEIIRRFSEAHNEDAGQHYTPREVIRLMVNLLFMNDKKILDERDAIKTLYDPACGTGDTLIKGDEVENIKVGNTLSDDKFPEDNYDYILSNPPFGREWKNEKEKVTEEAKKGFAGRFGVGLPAVNDSQLLFLQTALAKVNYSDFFKSELVHTDTSLNWTRGSNANAPS